MRGDNPFTLIEAELEQLAVTIDAARAHFADVPPELDAAFEHARMIRASTWHAANAFAAGDVEGFSGTRRVLEMVYGPLTDEQLAQKIAATLYNANASQWHRAHLRAYKINAKLLKI